jgi:hypothetical protein
MLDRLTNPNAAYRCLFYIRKEFLHVIFLSGETCCDMCENDINGGSLISPELRRRRSRSFNESEPNMSENIYFDTVRVFKVEHRLPANRWVSVYCLIAPLQSPTFYFDGKVADVALHDMSDTSLLPKEVLQSLSSPLGVFETYDANGQTRDAIYFGKSISIHISDPIPITTGAKIADVWVHFELISIVDLIRAYGDAPWGYPLRPFTLCFDILKFGFQKKWILPNSEQHNLITKVCCSFDIVGCLNVSVKYMEVVKSGEEW